jgi:Transposase IS4
MRLNPGPTSYATRRIVAGSPLSAWSLLCDESLLRHVKRCTDAEARRQRGEMDLWNVSVAEVETTFGLLYAKGLYMSSKTPVRLLWNSKWSPPLFGQAMARDRFYEIMRYMRFDEKCSRSERLLRDKFALATDLWSPFIENCIKCFNPFEELTIDEQLLPCKCRCRFIQYMANKPDKFGLKFFHVVDLKWKYVCNGFPYLGKSEERPEDETLAFHVVKKLVSPFEKGGYHITADNFFTSMKLVKYLLEKQFTYLGTVRLNKRELPDVNSIMRQEPRFASRFYKSADDDVTLILYRAKPNKVVGLLSSLHSNPHVPQPLSEKKKPDAVETYNRTKCGVDSFDAMARMYSTRCAIRRWPMYVLFNVLDIAAINSWVLYTQVIGTNISRRNFTQELVEELISARKPPQRAQQATVGAARKRRHCYMENCDNKTASACCRCQRPCCGTHVGEKTFVCCNCVN